MGGGTDSAPVGVAKIEGVGGLGLEGASTHEARAQLPPLFVGHAEGHQLERTRGNRRFGLGARLEHQHGRPSEAEPYRPRTGIPDDPETQQVLVEGEETIEVGGAEREMVQTHEDTEDARTIADAEAGPARACRISTKLIDAHCHLDFPVFDADRDAVFARARDAGVERFVIAGYSPETAGRAMALRGDSVRVAIGLHPWALSGMDAQGVDDALEALSTWTGAADAIGEFGVDAVSARRGESSLELQLAVARRLLALCRDSDKPAILHVVGAHETMLGLLREVGPTPGGMVHGFSGSAELARRWVSAGWHLSFGGALASPRSRRVREAAATVPLDRLLIESDAPEGALRGSDERGEPAALPRVLAALAEVRDEPLERLAEATAANAARLFFRG